HGVRADKTDLCAGFLSLDRFGDFAIILQRWGGGVDDDVIVLFCDAECLCHPDIVRWAIKQTRTGHQRGWLGQPRWIPIARNLAPRLITRAGAAVKSVEGGRG